jgi:phosphatidylserine/phosphatidylglycerophosphate/cardiolipin synthase-like enzyme
MAKEKDLLTRVSEAISGLFGEETAEHERPDDQERSASSFAEFLEKGREAIALLRLQPKPGRDLATAPGRQVEISVKVDFRLGPDTAIASVRFLLDGNPIGEAPLESDRIARLIYHPETPGLFAIDYLLLDKQGQTLPAQEMDRRPQLLVLQEKPVFAIESEIVINAEPDQLEPLRSLAERGWAMIYLDYDEKDRAAEIGRRILENNLPPGPILTHPSSELEFKTLGVDFRRLLATTTYRRLRTSGLYIAAALVRSTETLELIVDRKLHAITPETLHLLVADTEQLHRFEADAIGDYRHYMETSDHFGRALDIMTDTEATTGNSCRVVFDNGEARRRVFEIVEQARHNLKLQFYIFKECRFTEHLAVHLINAARRGVKVKLLVDALYSTQELFGLKNKIVEGLKSIDNIEIVAVNPLRAGDELEATRFKQRDHRKLIVADDNLAIVSGRNAGDEYYTGFDESPITDWTPDERIPWQDAHIEVRGPLVPDIADHFDRAWQDNGGSPNSNPAPPDPQIFPNGSRARLVVHRGVADSNSLGAYEAIIEEARDHIFVLNDFPVVTSLASALTRAVARGVEVNFITGCAVARRADGSFFKGSLHRELFEYMTKARFEALIHKGVRVYEFATPQLTNIVTVDSYIRPYIHGKVVTADGMVLSVGSANLDATASYWEDEILVVVEDRQLATQAEAELTEMIGRSHLIDTSDEYWKRESARREIVSRLWPDSLL